MSSWCSRGGHPWEKGTQSSLGRPLSPGLAPRVPPPSKTEPIPWDPVLTEKPPATSTAPGQPCPTPQAGRPSPPPGWRHHSQVAPATTLRSVTLPRPRPWRLICNPSPWPWQPGGCEQAPRCAPLPPAAPRCPVASPLSPPRWGRDSHALRSPRQRPPFARDWDTIPLSRAEGHASLPTARDTAGPRPRGERRAYLARTWPSRLQFRADTRLPALPRRVPCGVGLSCLPGWASPASRGGPLPPLPPRGLGTAALDPILAGSHAP